MPRVSRPDMLEKPDREKLTLRESWLDQLHRGVAERAARDADPLIRALENCLPPDATAISTVSICTLLGIRPTSGSARRVARIMRTLGFVPVRSRLLRPGGWRDTVGRGWVRPTINLQAGRIAPRKA